MFNIKKSTTECYTLTTRNAGANILSLCWAEPSASRWVALLGVYNEYSGSSGI